MLKTSNLRLPSPWWDEVEQAIADDTEGSVVVDDVITFLGGSFGSVEKLW